MVKLFEEFSFKNLQLPNRSVLSPMCQYKAEEGTGLPNNWHLVHLVSRAIGGTGLVMTEMTNVEERGRITENCLGLYNNQQQEKFKQINEEIHKYGAKSAIQIAHAGRKSTIENSDIVAPSPIPFSDSSPVPRELETAEVDEIIERFAESTKLAIDAGFDTIELHCAHGYLLHQFLSPASNKRQDQYGDPFLFPLRVIEAVKSAMPTTMPLILRISAKEYGPGGYDFDFAKEFTGRFLKAGVDMLDVSTGGDALVKPEVYPAYQTSYAKELKDLYNVPVISVGELQDPRVAELVLQEEMADLVAIGKGMLRNPYWTKEAATVLEAELELPGVYNLAY